MIVAWSIAGQESLRGTNCGGYVGLQRMTSAYLEVYSIPESSGSRVKFVVCNDRVFDTGTYGVVDGYVENHLKWVVLLDLS